MPEVPKEFETWLSDLRGGVSNDRPRYRVVSAGRGCVGRKEIVRLGEFAPVRFAQQFVTARIHQRENLYNVLSGIRCDRCGRADA